MKFLNVENMDAIKKDRIFKIAGQAVQAKKEGHYVYNATIGALYDEALNLSVHPSVYQVFNSIDNRVKAAYAPAVDGGVAYRDAILNWVFQQQEFLKVSRVVATPGGSGALTSAFAKIVKPGETIIIPDIFWAPYETMMKARDITATKCACFDGETFSLEPIKDAMREVAKKQQNIVVIMNDPAHNPTGYSMGLEKWQEFIAFINELAVGERTVTIINDIAYIDYAQDFETSRDYMAAFKEMNDNVLVIFAFSGSKTLTAYGMRLGASIIYANREEDRDNVYEIIVNTARASWSNVNHGAIAMFVELMAHPEVFQKDLQAARQMLAERTNTFKANADRVGLAYYPTNEGFFVTVRGMADNEALFQALTKKHVYVVPMPKGLRIATCALPLTQCETLPAIIKETIEELQHAN